MDDLCTLRLLQTLDSTFPLPGNSSWKHSKCSYVRTQWFLSHFSPLTLTTSCECLINCMSVVAWVEELLYRKCSRPFLPDRLRHTVKMEGRKRSGYETNRALVQTFYVILVILELKVWPSNTAGVVASAVFRTNSRHLQTYKGMQLTKNDAIWCKKYFPGPSGSCATAVKEDEE